MKSIFISTWKRAGVLVHRIVRHFGFVLLPINEIERMEEDGKAYYKAMRKLPPPSSHDQCYFNGLADYASKKAIQLRESYLPNDEMRDRHPQPDAENRKDI